MLAMVEGYLRSLGLARSDSEISSVLAEAARTFGFTSGYLLEYDSSSRTPRVLDTDPVRGSWWPEYFTSNLRPAVGAITTLQAGQLLRLDETRFENDHEGERLRLLCVEHDIVDIIVVPVSYGSKVIGVAGYCGAPEFRPDQELALTLLSYSAFAQLRGGPNLAKNDEADGAFLTSREREVIRLSAEGMTLKQIAQSLGISSGTADQYADNVADKLGTRNRAHTISESVRRGLI